MAFDKNIEKESSFLGELKARTTSARMFRLWLFCSTHAAQKGWASSEILSYLSAEGFNRKAILLPQFAQLISIDLYQLSKADKGHEIGFAEEPANSKNNASCTQQGKQGGYSIRKRYRNVSHSNNRRKVGPFLKAPFPLVKAVTQVTKKDSLVDGLQMKVMYS